MFLIVLVLLVNTGDVFAWDSEELEVFDVVEEVNQNFYEFLNISQNAEAKDIRTAFRILSLKLHPDKNPDEDTSVQFRNLVSVYDILRSPSKRRYYDQVLVNGLPNWRSAVYYYRHVRKLGLLETCIILTLIISLGQYLVGWASYVEQKYTFEQQLTKRKRKDKDPTKYEFDLPKPSLLNTLPIQVPCLLWWTIINLPKALLLLKSVAAERIDEMKQSHAEPEPEIVQKVDKKTARKRKPAFVLPEGPNFEITPTNKQAEENSAPPPVSGGLWTDDDLAELVQLVKKFPGGTPKRWEHIAEALGRSVPEVTFMANKMKANNFKVAVEEEEVQQPKVKQKTRAKIEEKAEEGAKKWSQSQQKALEEALLKFPKGCLDRWDRIAECVPDKTKEDCMIRYRHLAETVRQQKENVTQQNDQQENNQCE